ncbi:hypothetical protein Fmac_031343 [Flemingia macrophylla]|uniref:Clathrin heavy chain linker core motif domain-containing protein n=1 Tax=Flemingia macrophylla TaxID=520843 RepID=A0ABD1L1U4_9FABA
MESDKYICVRETSPQSSVVMIDMSMPMQPLRRPITADSALMNSTYRILGLKGNTGAQLLGDSEPMKMFDRTANLSNNQIINYRCDPNVKWLVLIGIAPGSLEHNDGARGCPKRPQLNSLRVASIKRPQLVKRNMQLFSVDQQRTQAHAACFATFRVAGNDNDSTLICFASKSVNAGQVMSKMHVIELAAQPGKPSFTKKQADLFFPPDFADDYAVSMQLGILFVYDLETATAVYRSRIIPDPVFLTTEASSVGGFYAINRRGQVLLPTINEAAIVPFVSGQLNNLELAVNLAKRGNLPGAEELVVKRFQELFTQTKYKEAAELAAESPQGILRTPETVTKFQTVPVQAGQTPPLLQYFGTLLTRGKLNAFESLELSRLVVNQNKKNLLENWLAEDKLECSEEPCEGSNRNLDLFCPFCNLSVHVGCTPDYLFLLQTILWAHAQRNLIRKATAFLLDVLKLNLPGSWISSNEGSLPHFLDYDRRLISQFCEKAGLFIRALQDPDIHLKYIEAAAKTRQIKEVERVTWESNFYDAEKTKNFLMEAKLPDARPLINLCDRFGFYSGSNPLSLTSNMLRYIEGYVQKLYLLWR